MDVLEQKRQEIEAEIFNILSEILPQIDHPRLKILITHRSAIRTSQELVGPVYAATNGKGTGKSAALVSWTSDLPPIPKGYPNRDGMTRGDAIVEILRPVSGGMHVKHIVEKLRDYNFEVGTHSAVGIMRGDVQKRFKKLGHSYYDLADFMRNGNPQSQPRPAFQRIKGFGGLTLRRAVMLVIDGLDRDELFNSPKIHSLLIKRFPESEPHVLKDSISVTLNNLAKDGTLEGQYVGSTRAKQYKKAVAVEMEADSITAANSNELALMP